MGTRRPKGSPLKIAAWVKRLPTEEEGAEVRLICEDPERGDVVIAAWPMTVAATPGPFGKDVYEAAQEDAEGRRFKMTPYRVAYVYGDTERAAYTMRVYQSGTSLDQPDEAAGPMQLVEMLVRHLEHERREARADRQLIYKSFGQVIEMLQDQNKHLSKTVSGALEMRLEGLQALQLSSELEADAESRKQLGEKLGKVIDLGIDHAGPAVLEAVANSVKKRTGG